MSARTIRCGSSTPSLMGWILRRRGLPGSSRRRRAARAMRPRDLLKLYIYGYLNRVRSSRRLEAETHRNIEVIWLLRHLKPDFKTIADFRRDNRAAFRPVFRQFVLLCRQLDLFGRELLAVDGTRIKAVNNKDRNFTRASLREFIRRADAKLDDYLQRLDEGDAAESATRAARGSRTWPRRSRRSASSASATRAMLAELERTGESQISLTDPDSRAMAAHTQVARRLQRSGRGRRQAQADRRAAGDQPGRRHGPADADRGAGPRSPRRRDDRCRRRSRLLQDRGHRGLREGRHAFPTFPRPQRGSVGRAGPVPQGRVPIRRRARRLRLPGRAAC